MWVIRREQMDSFMQEFEDRLTRHVAAHFPDDIKPLGEEGLREKVKLCVVSARGYGIWSEIGIALYTDACFALGEQQPSIVPGASETLDDEELDGDTKARKFCDRIILYLDEREDELSAN